MNSERIIILEHKEAHRRFAVFYSEDMLKKSIMGNVKRENSLN